MMDNRRSIARWGRSSHRRPLDVGSELVRWRMWWICHGSYHVKHCIVAFVSNTWMQKTTAHTPGALSSIVKSTNGPRFRFLWTSLVTVTQLPFFKFGLNFFAVFFGIFFIIYLASLSAITVFIFCLES